MDIQTVNGPVRLANWREREHYVDTIVIPTRGCDGDRRPPKKRKHTVIRVARSARQRGEAP